MNTEIDIQAPVILEAVKNSKRILLHCHPHPDPDSIGSVIALTEVLRRMGKEVTPIGGDSPFPDSLKVLPNSDEILPLKFSEVDQNKIDLFIILDSSSLNQITREVEVIFPKNIKTVVIDHHKSNLKFGDINLVDATRISTCEILTRLFEIWNEKITPEMAICLFLGIYADSGGFKYIGTTSDTLRLASELTTIYPNYHKFVFDFDNNRSPVEIELMGLALSSIETHFSGNFALSVISYEELKKRGIDKEDATDGLVGDILRSVKGWNLVASLVEMEPGMVVMSFRTRDEGKYDVSKLATTVGEGGGGHRGAAGTKVMKPLDEAKKILLETVARIYPEIVS